MDVLLETEYFKVLVPSEPFVDRVEGGNLIIYSKIAISDRTELTDSQAMEYIKLSMLVGEALKAGMAERGVDIGIINYQENGNWSVFKSGGPTMHLHVFGRAKSATKQKYGEALQLPKRDSGFYDEFMPLDKDDVIAIKKNLDSLVVTPKYSHLSIISGTTS